MSNSAGVAVVVIAPPKSYSDSMVKGSVAEKVREEFSRYPKRSYPKGQILVFADENPDHIFYLVNGRVRQYDISSRGDEVIVNVYKPPAFFPMSWAITRTPNRYFYKTESATELFVVPADKAVAFLKANPDVMFDLLARVYSGIGGLLGRVTHLMSGTARSRLIYELIIECRRFGTLKRDGSYSIISTEIDLAARTGLSRETVSREMHALKASKWVTLTDKHIFINDLAKLQQALGNDET